MENKRPKIAVVFNAKLNEDHKRRLELLGDVIYYDNSTTDNEEWLKRCKDADIICSGIPGMNSEKLYELNNVYISLPLVGVEYINIEKAKNNNIAISNCPGCNKEAVSEWILGMMIYGVRNFSRNIRSDMNNRAELLDGNRSLYEKNITILGAGHVGKEVERLCKPFYMKVNFFRRGDNLINSVKEADIVVNCLSSNSSTMGLLDREFFMSLKKGSFFVSVGRNNIYDINGLKEAIDECILIGAADDAGSDVVGDTNGNNYKELVDHPKIIVTPHIAWNTDFEKNKANNMMIDNIEAWLKKEPINLIW